MTANKIKFLIAERRTVDRGPEARPAELAEEFRNLLDDLDDDIYEASFPPAFFSYQVDHSLPDFARRAMSESCHFLLFYRLFEGSYNAAAVLRDLAPRMAQGKGPIALVTFFGANISMEKLLDLQSRNPPLPLNDNSRAIWEAWLESLNTPGIILTPLQEMSDVGVLMRRLVETYGTFAARKGLYYDTERGFLDTNPLIEETKKLLEGKGDRSGRLLGIFKKK